MTAWFRPLDDLPLDEAGLDGWQARDRLAPLAEAIARQLERWLAEDRQGEPPRIGLFGGLGQGKSTVLAQCLALLEGRRLTNSGRWWKGCGLRLRDFFLGPPVARFDITQFKADDLEWRFLTAVLWHRVRHTLLVIALPLLMLELLVLWSLGLLSFQWSISGCIAEGGMICSLWLIGATLALLLPLIPLGKGVWKAFSALRKLNPAQDLYVARRDWWMHVIAEFVHALPRIVVVDDLDRARVEQQRALLRAMLRFSRQMGFAVVICLDESELLDSPPAPEAPEELLRKVIQFELRLPDRGREDVVLMVLALSRQQAERNPEWGARLLAPAWLAALVRALLLMGPPGGVSPRQIKRLVNDVLLRAEQLKLTAVGDICALLRLECLCRLAPGLRPRATTLLKALEARREADMQSALTLANTGGERLQAAIRFFKRSGTMQPTHSDGWFRLTGGLPMTAESDSGSAATNRSKSANGLVRQSSVTSLASGSQDFFRLFLAAVEHLGNGYPASLDLYDAPSENAPRAAFDIPAGGRVLFLEEALPKNYKIPHDPTLMTQCWLLWVAALTDADADERGRMYRAAEDWLDRFKREDLAVVEIGRLLLRERLADGEVWRLLADKERSYLLGLEGGLPARAFHDILLADLRPDDGRIAMHALARTTGQRDFRQAAFWLAQVKAPRVADLDAAASSEPVARSWPPLAVADQGWGEGLRAQSESLLLIDKTYQMPASIAAAWWGWALPWLDTAQCLDVLHAAAHPGGATEWSLERMAVWLNNRYPSLLPSSGRRLPEPLERLSRDGTLDWSNVGILTANQRLTAVALAAQMDWQLEAILANAMTDVRSGALTPMLEALFQQCLAGQTNWLAKAEPEFVLALLKRAGRGPERAWQSAMATAWPDAANDVFAALGWPPHLE